MQRHGWVLKTCEWKKPNTHDSTYIKFENRWWKAEWWLPLILESWLRDLRELSGGGVKWSESHSVVSDSLQPHGLYNPWNSPGQNTGVGSHSVLQGIFPIQGLNRGLLHCRWILYQLSYQWVEEMLNICFLIGVVIMWAYTFVKIGQILQLQCMHFITCKLHFN